MVSLVDNDDDPQRRGVVHLRMTIPIWMRMRVLLSRLWSYVGYLMTMTMIMMPIVKIRMFAYDVSVVVAVSVVVVEDDDVVQWQQVCPVPVPSEHSRGTCWSLWYSYSYHDTCFHEDSAPDEENGKVVDA